MRTRASSPMPFAGALAGLALGGLACFALASASCKGNHSALAPDPDAGGAGPKATSSTKASTASTTAGAGGAPSEPDGPTRFTFVNGVVDEPSVSFCFVPYPSGMSTRQPFPSGGLAFGHAYVAPAASPDIPSSDALVMAVSGTMAPGTTCGDIASDPMAYPDLTAVGLGVIPASALSMRRSFLFITDGCFGGAGHAGNLDAKVCGKDYATATPNPGLSVLAMSRISDPAHVGFQYVNAVAAAPKLSASLQPGVSGVSSRPIASGVALGAAQPYPPSFMFGASDVGPVSGAAILSVAPPDTMFVSTPLDKALGAAGLSAANVANGKDVVLVGVGATPGTPPGAWWNDFTVVAVQSDPL